MMPIQKILENLVGRGAKITGSTRKGNTLSVNLNCSGMKKEVPSLEKTAGKIIAIRDLLTQEQCEELSNLPVWVQDDASAKTIGNPKV